MSGSLPSQPPLPKITIQGPSDLGEDDWDANIIPRGRVGEGRLAPLAASGITRIMVCEAAGQRSGAAYGMRTETPRASSERLSRVGSRDTAPELAVRRLLHSLGHRCCLRRGDPPGRPPCRPAAGLADWGRGHATEAEEWDGVRAFDLTSATPSVSRFS